MRSAKYLIAAAVAVLGVSVSGQIPPYGGAAELRADLAARRANAMTALGPESILIAWSAPAKVYSTDVNYEYRQESNMLYLSGMTQEESILVLIPAAKTKREILFTLESDPRREHWNGHTLTPAEVTAESGVSTVYPLSAFQPFIDGLLSGTGYQMSSEEASTEFGGFINAIRAGKARLGIFERVGGPDRHPVGSACETRGNRHGGRHEGPDQGGSFQDDAFARSRFDLDV